MKRDVYEELSIAAKQALLIERAKKALQLQYKHMKRDGVQDIYLVFVKKALAEMRRAAIGAKFALPGLCVGEPIYDFVMEYGLTRSVFLALGCLPPMVDIGLVRTDKETGEILPSYFPNPAKVSKYLGLHVDNGTAPKRKAGEFSGWNAEVKSFFVVRIAKPCMWDRTSPYRAVYDARRERTTVTHPDLLPECECETCDKAYEHLRKNGKKVDCAHFGGVHWTDGHRHADALRITAKAILRDLWCVENGKRPRLGHSPFDAQSPTAEPVAV